jgi:hypothetical protein
MLRSLSLGVLYLIFEKIQKINNFEGVVYAVQTLLIRYRYHCEIRSDTWMDE